LVKAVTGVEKLVPKGKQDSLEIFVDIPEPGEYTLKGKVNFEGKSRKPST